MTDTPGGFNPTGLASMTVTAALVGLMSTLFTCSMITVVGCHLTVLEGSMYYHQDIISIVTGVLVISLVSLGSVNISNTTIEVIESSLASSPGFPTWRTGTSGRLFELSFLVLGTDFGGLMAAAISNTPFAAFTGLLSTYMASQTASGPSYVRDGCRITLRRCTHTTTPYNEGALSSNIVKHFGGAAAFQNMSTQNSFFLLETVHSSTTTTAASSSLVPYVAGWTFLDGGTVFAAQLTAFNVTLAATNVSLVYALMTDTLATVPLYVTVTTTNISLEASTMIMGGSDEVVVATTTLDRAPPLIHAAAPLAHIAFRGNLSHISILSTNVGNSCNHSSTLATPDRVQSTDDIHLSIGCDVVCGKGGIPLMCSGASWVGTFHANLTPQTCPLCSPPQTDGPTTPTTGSPLPHQLPMATKGAVATSAIASLVGSIISSTLPSMAVTAAATSGIMRMSGALRLWQRCSAFEDGGFLNDNSGDDDESVEPIFDDVVDNPLGLELPIEAAGLKFAAGAALGNTVIVIAVGIVSHLSASLRRRVRTVFLQHVSPPNQWITQPPPNMMVKQDQHQHTTLSAKEWILRGILATLPSWSLPTTLFTPYAVLLVPTISASIALLASADRNGSTVAVGVVGCFVWSSVAIVLTFFAVTQVAAADGRFVLETRGPKKAADAARQLSASAAAARWWMEPTSEWSVRTVARPVPARQRWMLERVTHPLVEPHRLRWYFVVEWLLAFAGGAVLGVAAALRLLLRWPTVERTTPHLQRFL
ncbi:membrane-associated protein, putative [Bodo saltans]|uniref:Membrane-associated protein, putative n=1 Tax=Bodo saltans TaxID=75058 RepID=A0A0S4JV48_BODSA|nr:membrane-associated protein, putative [Bodo saltans]|eukprot:CUG94291.1 membrane-associated protein, putative [Bodo saltans]